MASEIRRIWQQIGTTLFGGNVVVANGQTSPMLNLGGTTSAYPALRRSSSTLLAYLGDGSDYANFWASSLVSCIGDIRAWCGNAALQIGSVTELLTVAAAATSDSVASLLPAKSIILAVSCRVTTIIPTATSFTLGGASAGGPFTDAVLVAADSTDNGMVAVPYLNATAQKIRLTISGSNPANNTGRVRIVVFYIQTTAPTG